MISIITPTYNSELTLRRTVESIFKQTLRPLEWVVVDNESSDSTLDIVKEYANRDTEFHVVVISEKDSGISDAFNKGIKNSQGDIIGILNSDDEYVSDNVLINIKNEFERKNTSIVHANMEFIDEDFGSNVRAPLLCEITHAMPFNHPTCFLKRKIYEEFGLFREDFRYAMDFELFCRLYNNPHELKVSVQYLDQVTVKMYAGGVSCQYEIKSIDEVIKSLKLHNLYSINAFLSQNSRKFRIYLKQVLQKIGLAFIVKLWRNKKWYRS